MFAAVAPIMIHEATDARVRAAINSFLLARAKREFEDDKELRRKELRDFTFQPERVETVIVQFRALGLIEQSVRPRSVRDSTTYWRLTKHGDNLMTKLRAIRRTPHRPKSPAA
jgi:hypothetical protein